MRSHDPKQGRASRHRRGDEGGAPDAPSPAETVPALTERELDALRQVGRHWNAVLGRRIERLRALPVDPSLEPLERGARRKRFSRFEPVSMFRRREPIVLEAEDQAAQPLTEPGRVLERLQRIILGPPLRSSAVVQERMRKLIALPVLSSDLLSSVAYGPEAMLSVLVLAGRDALGLSLPLAAVLVVLMLAVATSYRQTIAAYPSGAGSYIVAGDNLGQLPGLAAAVGLLADYVLTVAVSVAAGVAAITSAAPALGGSAVPLGMGAIALLLAGNLRGAREAGYLFAAPTYLFVIAMLLLIGVGLAQAAEQGFAATPPPPIKGVEGVTVLLVLRAFSSGATSMTGIEAVANSVTAFERPESRNARTVLAWMVGILITIFIGLVFLIHLNGLVPRSNETLLSQLAHRSLGGGVLYGFVQAATALILLFAANTAFNGFPRLLFFMARNQHAPRVFLRLGDRLAFSNGIVALGLAAAIVYAGFHGKTEALIPLFAVGVFLAVTLSQVGMVVHWRRTRGPGWLKNLFINGFGAALSALVLLVAAVTKFTAGAWVVVIGIPLVIWICLRIRAHYNVVGEAVAPRPVSADVPRDLGPRRGAARSDLSRAPGFEPTERQESPDEIRHLMLVTVERLDLANLRALAYTASLDQPLLAVHISPDEEEADRFRREWDNWGVPLQFEIVVSPYRAIVAPLAHYIEVLQAQQQGLTTTVIIPELVVRRSWQRLLHSHVGPRLRLALTIESGVVITTVPFHLPA